MWTGIRISPLCSSMARVIAWRNPPDCIGRELVAPFWIEFFNRPEQTDAAFLDEITERERVVTASDPDNELLVSLEKAQARMPSPRDPLGKSGP